MTGSVFNSQPITSPTSSRLAFTVLFSTTNANASDVQIEFNSFGNFYERDRDNEGIVYDFAGLFSSPAITVVKSTRTASCILASLGLGGVMVSRRFFKRGKQRPK